MYLLHLFVELIIAKNWRTKVYYGTYNSEDLFAFFYETCRHFVP